MKHTLALLFAMLYVPLDVVHGADATPAAPKPAGLATAAIFSDHLVLQREAKVPVWGTARAGESVSVTFAGQTKSAVAGADGHWRVVLDPLQAGHTGALVVQAGSSITINDVQVGDVWLCAGDAFLSRTVTNVRSARSELASRELPTVRLFRVNTKAANEPQSDLSGSWTIPNRQNIGDFPALAYLFAKEMQATTGVPVGIIEATDTTLVTIQRGGKVTGSTVEAWISDATLRVTPAAASLFEFYRSPLALRKALAEYENALGDWKLKTNKAFGAELRELEKREPDVWYDYLTEMRKAGKPAPTDPPRKPTAESLRLAPTHAANLHNGMIAPLAGFAVRGVVLCLGMANAPRATQYRTLFPALLQDWRTAWNRDDLPFVFLQQARATHPNMDPRALAELREAQAAAANTPHTAMVRTIDLEGNGFPEDVRTLAKRLAVSARTLADDRSGTRASSVGSLPTSAAGPVIEKVSFEGHQAVVQFRAGAAGLTVRGGGVLQGFALTERPNRWAYAEAQIEGDRVIVTQPKLKAPVALRYDWVVEAGREGNLTDASGLPALPYRSDAWPAFTDTPAAMKPNAVATIQPADLYPVADPSLPRVLLIGDSIMNGYSPFVISQLQGKVNIVRLVAFGMIGGNDASAAAFCAKLKDGDYGSFTTTTVCTACRRASPTSSSAWA